MFPNDQRTKKPTPTAVRSTGNRSLVKIWSDTALHRKKCNSGYWYYLLMLCYMTVATDPSDQPAAPRRRVVARAACPRAAAARLAASAAAPARTRGRSTSPGCPRGWTWRVHQNKRLHLVSNRTMQKSLILNRNSYMSAILNIPTVRFKISRSLRPLALN